MAHEKDLRVNVVELIKLEKSGIVDLEGLYKRIWGWMVENGYMCLERNQTIKVLPDGKDIKIEWRGYRNIDDYVRFWVEAEIWILRCIDIIVDEDGQRIKRQKGDLQVRFESFLDKDYRLHFRRTQIGQFLRIAYEKYLIKERLLRLEDKLREETFKLQQAAKEILSLLVR